MKGVEGLEAPIVHERNWRRAALLSIALVCAAAMLTLRDFAERVPPSAWFAALVEPDFRDTQQVLVHYTVLPRAAVSILCGAGLGLAGVVCQQVLRNPLAEPTTLGVSAGASLALSAATLWAPELLVFGGEWVAMAGGIGAILLVFGLTWSRALSPVALVLAGMIVTLYCSALTSALGLFHRDYLTVIFLWGTGYLTQQDWSAAGFLLPRFAAAAIMIALIARPLTLLGLDDDTARNLGLGLTGTRFAALAIVISLSAAIVSVAGVIAFVGLVAPALVAMAGARRFRDRLIWAPVFGAGLLWLTDRLVLLIPTGYREIPTGVATALLGAPLLLALLPKLRTGRLWITDPPFGAPRWRDTSGLLWISLALLLIGVWMALAFAYGPDGWHWCSIGETWTMLPWRGPRTLAALSAGALLAAAGAMMQRMLGNPMASPEVLGVASGASLSVIVTLFFVQDPSRGLQMIVGSAGAVLLLAGILLLSRRAAFSSEHLLLAGVATSAAFGAIVSLALATGDPRTGILLTWIAGSTYGVGAADALLTFGAAVILISSTPLVARWLDILPLGDRTAASLGIDVGRSRLLIMLVSATMTAVATLVVGPLSFVSLMAPHLARLIGLQRALHHVVGAAILGALLMIVADWAGRTVIYPFQVPAGLLATLIGGPYLMLLLRNR